MYPPNAWRATTTEVWPDIHALVFSKAPDPGGVKTRLCPPLTPARAAALYRTLVSYTLDTVCISGLHGQLYSPQAHDWLQAQADSRCMPLRRQHGKDLGERMHNAITESLAAGARAATVIGCDCPDLSWQILTDTADILSQAQTDLVLGPTLDGGYYLIGMHHPHTALFTDMPWSTEDVLDITLERARDLGLRTHRLPPLADVDRPADLAAHPWLQPAWVAPPGPLHYP